ncbi:MAG: hypothetical protein PUC65_10045 [Clostridiales bacterium]|nr:hypothetical protein [Clostridiales bacterium]
MITWNEKLYFSESIKKKHRRTIFAIKHGKVTANVYCIAFASNEKNLFDILPANELLFPHYKNSEVHILGLARGRDEAALLVMDMIRDIYRETGGFSVREFFREK